MKVILEYLFYRLYKLSSYTNKSIPEWSSMIFLTMSLFLNVFTTIILTGLYNNVFLKQHANLAPAFMIVLLIGNYFLLLHKKRHLKIIKHYKVESKSKTNVGHVVILFYIVVTLGVLYFALKAVPT